MKPTLLQPREIDTWLRQGHWTKETLIDRYRHYARAFPSRVALRDSTEELTWEELDAVTDGVAANLIELGLPRDARALVQMPSSCREIIVRLSFKKAGIIGAFAPMQWRQRELRYVMERIEPALFVCRTSNAQEGKLWLNELFEGSESPAYRVDSGSGNIHGWLGWQDLIASSSNGKQAARISERQFAFDEISLITASSGTSGLAKLCEWPEAAQMCVGRGIAARMAIQAEDRVGVFAPMSGAAGLVVWLASAEIPCSFVFPEDYSVATLLGAVEESRLTVGTTVPVILSRLAESPLEKYELGSLRALRVGTAATDCRVALQFEERTGCRVVVASGSMEVPGFGHAGAEEPRDKRLDGSVGLPLPGGRLRIDDKNGRRLAPGEIGELKVAAPFASSGYWNDPEGTMLAWTDGWYSSGDLGTLDADGRLRLKGRIKDIVNRSGLKIIPQEVEQEICSLPDILECAVVSAPDREYGEVPWAFVRLRAGRPLNIEAMVDKLHALGMARYKIPVRFIEMPEMPRVGDNKVDRNALRRMAAEKQGIVDDPGFVRPP